VCWCVVDGGDVGADVVVVDYGVVSVVMSLVVVLMMGVVSVVDVIAAVVVGGGDG